MLLPGCENIQTYADYASHMLAFRLNRAIHLFFRGVFFRFFFLSLYHNIVLADTITILNLKLTVGSQRCPDIPDYQSERWH